MKCSTEKARGFYEKATEIIVNKATTIKAVGDENIGMTYYFHPEISKKYSEKGVFPMGEEKRNKLQKFLDTHQELGEPLSLGWINGPHFDTRTGQFWMTVKMPKATADAIDLADNMRLQYEYEEEAIKEAEKAYKFYRQITEDDFTLDEENELMSMAVTDNSDPLEEELSKMNFHEYRDNRVRLLEKIQEEYEMYRKTAKKGEEKKSNIKKYNQIISYLIKDIEQLKADEFNTVQKSVEDELVYLESIIDTLEVDSIEFNNVIDRLETLSNYFTGKTIRSKSLGEDYTSEFIKLADNRLRPEFINEVKARVGDLTKKYQDKEKDLVYKMVLSNPSIKEHLDSGAMTYEDLEDLKLLIDTQEDINWLTQMMLGIHSGGGPLGQILGTYFESMTARERASTASKVKRLKEIVQLYKIDPKSFEKHIISDNGTRVPTGRLIHPYSNNYFKITGQIYELFRKFQGSDFKQRRTSYSKYMQTRKNNQEVIDITKIRSFKEKYGNTPFGGEVFTSTEKEMIEYENQMKILMGEKIFNYILKEQEALVEDYVLSVKDAETEEKYIMSSPFYFAKHYNSPYYYLPVVNSINGKNYFPSSYYNVFVPKKEKKDLSSGKTVETDFYDKDFQKLFEEDSIKDKEKFEAWEIFTELLTGVNKTLQAQGISVSTLELPMVDAFIAKEFIKAKNISLGRKTGYITNSILDSWKKIYYNTSYLRNIENEDPNKIFISYRNTVKQSADKHYKILLSYSLDKIQQIAEKENLGYRDINNQLADIKSEDFKNQVIKSERERLAKMIAYKRSYNKASSDIFTTLEALVDITDVTRARVSTSIFANVVKGYVESKVEGMKIKTEDGKILKQHSNKNLAEFFDIWTKGNIYGNPLAAEKKEGKMFKIFSSGKNLQLFKYRNQQEKELNKILRETIKDLKNPDLEFEFKYEGLTYKRIKNKDGKMQSIKMSFDPINPEYEDITSEEFREVYEEHVKSAINKTGIPLTFGSLIQGSLQMQVLKSLLINLKSGFTNRHSGIIQNDLAAASGRLFDEAGLSQARTMLSFYNAQRYIKAIPGVKKLSFFYKERALQLETLDLLAKDYFKLLQDKKDQFARAEEYSQQKFSSVFSLMDFAVNNPENHNQLEVVLAVLARIEVYDNNGEKHFFVENNKFTIYEPGTLEVKENFRRGYRMIEDKDGNFIKDFVDNVRIWEEFSEEKGKKNTHLHVFNLISRAIDRTQGNYNDKDIAAVFSSTTGKTLMLFKRFLPEQVNANFGTMDFDLATGLRKYEGRKVVLFRHAPTALIHLTFSAGISTGFIAALPLPILISSAIGGSIILYNIFRFFKKAQKDSLTIDRNSLLVSLDYMQEVLLRSLNVPFRMITQGRNQKWKITVRGKEIPLNAIDLSKSISDKISPLSYEERRVLSESAQEIAERLKYMGLKLSIYLSLIALAIAADGDDDDDEAKVGILKKYEGFLNFLGNRFSMFSEEIEMYSSPFRFKDEMGQVMLLKKTDEIKSFVNDTKDYFDFEGDSPSLNKFIKLPFVPLPLPNQLNDQLFKENTSFITDSRRYEKDWIENLIERPETYIDDTIYQNQRKKFKEDIQKRARKQLKEKFPEWDNWQRVEEAKRISDALMRQGQEFGLKKVNKRGPAVYEEPVDFLERTSKYDIFTDEEVDREIEKRINGYYKRGKKVLGSEKYREKNKWE